MKSTFEGEPRGWTVRVDLTPEQETVAWRNIGAQRFAYNWAVAQFEDEYGRGPEGTGESGHRSVCEHVGTNSARRSHRGGRRTPRRRTRQGSWLLYRRFRTSKTGVRGGAKIGLGFRARSAKSLLLLCSQPRRGLGCAPGAPL